MSTPRNAPPAAGQQQRLPHIAAGDAELERLISARRCAESAITIAMVTSAIPGIEVTELEQEIIVLGELD